jgi:aspartate racemase
MLSPASKLAKAGADFLICPDNTIHQALRTAPRSRCHRHAEDHG